MDKPKVKPRPIIEEQSFIVPINVVAPKKEEDFDRKLNQKLENLIKEAEKEEKVKEEKPALKPISLKKKKQEDTEKEKKKKKEKAQKEKEEKPVVPIVPVEPTEPEVIQEFVTEYVYVKEPETEAPEVNEPFLKSRGDIKRVAGVYNKRLAEKVTTARKVKAAFYNHILDNWDTLQSNGIVRVNSKEASDWYKKRNDDIFAIDYVAS